jgi:mannosyl-oligosaccharide alpha-1,2-mannosidase
MLGGRALGRGDIFQFGLEIMEGCWHAYNTTPSGISPERIAHTDILADSRLEVEK